MTKKRDVAICCDHVTLVASYLSFKDLSLKTGIFQEHFLKETQVFEDVLLYYIGKIPSNFITCIYQIYKTQIFLVEYPESAHPGPIAKYYKWSHWHNLFLRAFLIYDFLVNCIIFEFCLVDFQSYNVRFRRHREWSSHWNDWIEQKISKYVHL